MSNFLRQSTASQSRAIGPFLDSTDFQTAKTGLTIANTDIKLVVNGGASANKNSGGGTHRVNGVYGVTFDATDTATVGEIEVSVVVSGALPVFHKFWVLEEAAYDALFAASAPGYVANAPVNVAQFGGTNLTAASGIPEVKVASIANNAITAASINADAITDAKVAADVTIASVTGAVGSVTGNVGGNVTGSVGSVATGGITAGSIAADAIGASELAADAITEIQSGLATAANLATVAGYLDTEIAAILADTNELQTDLVDGGRLDLILDAINAKTTNLPSDPADASVIAGRFDTLDTNIAAIDTVVDSILVDTAEIGAAGAGLTVLATAAELAKVPKSDGTATWNATAAAQIQSEANDALVAYDPPTKAELDSAVSPLATSAALATVDGIVDNIVGVTEKLDDTLEDQGGGTFGFTSAALQEAPGGGSAPTASEIADAVWDEATAGHTTSGTFGEQVKTDIDAILEDTGTTLQGELDGIQADTEDIQSRLPAALVSGRIDASVGAMAANTVTASAVAADAVTEIQSGLATAAALTTVDTVVDAIQAKTDLIPASPAAVGSAMTLTTGERTAIANEVEAQIIDETDSEKVLTAITDKIAAVNPSLEDLTLAAIASSVRTELTTELGRIDAAISSRASQTSVDDVPTNSELATALAGADDAVLTAIADLPTNAELATALGDIPTADENADALLKRDWSAVTGEASRSVLNALRFIRNKFSTTAHVGQVTVYKEDDTTEAYTKTLTTDANADPIVEG